MRQILVEHTRAQLAAKRGNRPERVDISVADRLSKAESEELVILDAGLTKLAAIDERKSKWTLLSSPGHRPAGKSDNQSLLIRRDEPLAIVEQFQINGAGLIEISGPLVCREVERGLKNHVALL